MKQGSKERTIREAICDSLEVGESGIVGLPFPYMLSGFAQILYADAAQRLGNKIDTKVISVLAHDVLSPESLAQFLQLSGFLEWWLDQPAKVWLDVDDDVCWYDMRSIGNAWNQWAREENARRGT